jgi:hypothetical protein
VPATPPKSKRYPFAPRSAPMRALTRSCAFVLGVNWVMQGMRGMDSKELSFRLLAELAVAVGLAMTLAACGVGQGVSIPVAAFLAHSLSFTLNGQLWVCVRYCPGYRGDAARLDGFMRRTADALRRAGWLDEAVVIGSMGQGALGPRSDLDLRLVFPVGVGGWLRTNLLLLRLRARAFLSGVPLDAYAYDRPRSLGRFDPVEPWVVLLDRHGRIATLFSDRRLTSLP